ICLRWRGTYNGGSDYMTLLILLTVSAASLSGDHPRVVSVALGYIAIQSALSYFIAGIAKIRHREWRTGEALSRLLNSPVYATPESARAISHNRAFCFAGSWAV